MVTQAKPRDGSWPRTGGGVVIAWPYENIDEFLIARGLYVGPIGSGQGKRACSTGSYHCIGQARDYGDGLHGNGGCWAIYNELLPFAIGPGFTLVELFWNHSGKGWKRGANIGMIPNHWDHVHAALQPGKWLPVEAPPPPPPPKAKVYGRLELVSA